MNTKIGIISGFLGAGKTTLIQKLLKGTLSNKKSYSLKMNLAKSVSMAKF